MLKLVQSLNKHAGERALPDIKLDKAFETWWANFEGAATEAKNASPSVAAPTPSRSERELLEELLQNSRSILKKLSEAERSPGPLRPPKANPLWLQNIPLSDLQRRYWAYYALDPSQPVWLGETEGKTQGAQFPAKDTVTTEQRRVLAHLCYEPKQTVEDLARNTGLSLADVKRVLEELGQAIVDTEGNGLLTAVIIDRKWARELAEEASRERKQKQNREE